MSNDGTACRVKDPSDGHTRGLEGRTGVGKYDRAFYSQGV